MGAATKFEADPLRKLCGRVLCAKQQTTEKSHHLMLVALFGIAGRQFTGVVSSLILGQKTPRLYGPPGNFAGPGGAALSAYRNLNQINSPEVSNFRFGPFQLCPQVIEKTQP